VRKARENVRVLVALGMSRERADLAQSGRDLRLSGRVGLVHRGSLLAACLSTIFMVAETDKDGDPSAIGRRSGRRAYVPELWLLVTVLQGKV
jgi:hypothetical protein